MEVILSNFKKNERLFRQPNSLNLTEERNKIADFN